VRIIDKYLLREFLLPVMYCFDAFLMLFIVQDLLENLGDFLQYHARATQVFTYYMTILPEAFVLMLPMSLLLGVLFCLSNLGKNNELIALRACGISVVRMAVPLLAVGVVSSVALFVVNDMFVPTAKARADSFMSELRGRGSRVMMDNFFYSNPATHRDWYIRHFNTFSNRLDIVEVHQQKPDGTQQLVVFAQSGVWTNKFWRFNEVEIYNPTEPDAPVPHLAATNFLTFTETPKQLAIEGRKPDELLTKELRNHIASLKASHRTARLADYEVTLDYRFSFPLTAVIVIWLGIPLGVRTSRRGGALLGVGTALILVISFFFLTQIALAMGRGERIPPLVAAWLTNAVFATVGAVLMARSS
jgi:LPS export ABC transporter permease LptG